MIRHVGPLSEEEQFWLTPVGKSVSNWLQFMQRAMSFGDAVSRGVSTMVPVAKLFAKYPRFVRIVAPKAVPHIEQAVELGEAQLAENFSFLNALTLMAAWGSFEAFVEDFCLAVLQEDQSPLRSEPLSKLKVEIGTLFTTDASVLEDVLEIGYNHQNSALKEGSGSFESRLKLVQLEPRGPTRARKRDIRCSESSQRLGTSIRQSRPKVYRENSKFAGVLSVLGWRTRRDLVCSNSPIPYGPERVRRCDS